MRITFHGAARTVTGSMHLVECGGARILLECGLYQGKREEAERRNRGFPFRPADVDAVVLSHAHIDHSGNLPGLVRQGFRGKVYATPATADLCAVMLKDSAAIQERDSEFVNKKRKARGEPPKEPLYRMEDAEEAAGRLVPVPYREPREIAAGAALSFLDAGHILGSAVVVLDLREDGRAVRLAFTGDLGVRRAPILRDPETPDRPDILVTESTYGDREHSRPDDLKESLRAVIRRTLDRGGKVIIPAFSVGRTQVVVYFLHLLWEEGRLPRVPVYVDSPLSVNATEVFRAHPECYDEEVSAHLARGDDPFGFQTLAYVRTVEESKALNGNRDPCIVISASGMCEHGRILHHLRNAVGERKNTVLIVGYQAVETLGRRLAEGAPRVRIFGEEREVEAEVVVLDGFSAHADRPALLEYGARLKGSLRGVFAVHGDPGPAEALARGLSERGVRGVRVPAPGEAFDL